MAIEGLPNPQIHRLCKRCRQWFNAHEITLHWPPKTGLLTWVHVTMAEHLDQAQERKAYCAACQALNGKAEARFVRVSRQVLIAMVVVAALAALAWMFGTIEMFSAWVRGR